jgi:ATP-dependent RNA helicase RhlE
MTQFSELSISAVLKGNLARHGFTQPTPVQQESIEPALAGKDVVATAQTGTGKTLAFVLPILERLGQKPGRGVQALVLSPTRELAIQIDETFRKMASGTNIRSAVVVGGLSENTQLNAIRKGVQVVIATPGRLCDFLGRNLVQLNGVRILVLDEADRMLDMGFLPAIHRITAALPADRQTMFFSATIESSVKHLVESHVKDAVRVAVGSITKPVEQVELFLYEVEQSKKHALLENMLREEEGTFLVFARTKHGADRISKRLGQSGFKTAAIHGDRSQNQRNQALKGFQNGQYRVLVATDVAARGIHVEGISHVVNFDLPQVPEDFIHRVGRTGRAGARGIASTFASCAERSEIQRIERTIGMKLTHRGVATEVPASQQAQGAPVIVLTPAVQRAAKWRSFRPGNRRRAR